MEFFEIEGATLLHWKITVAAQDEGEAVDGVREKIAACIDTETTPVAVSSMEHRVFRCSPALLGERHDPLAE
jgi:hypothetical protein